MLVSCSATPRLQRVLAGAGLRQPKIRMQISPTAEATRRQYSSRSSNVCVPRGVEIHRDAVDHILERLARQVERAR